MPMKHDNGSPLWPAARPMGQRRHRVWPYVFGGFAIWGLIAVGAYALARAVT